MSQTWIPEFVSFLTKVDTPNSQIREWNRNVLNIGDMRVHSYINDGECVRDKNAMNKHLTEQYNINNDSLSLVELSQKL